MVAFIGYAGSDFLPENRQHNFNLSHVKVQFEQD
jgi:hypothetical protein